MDQSPLLQAYRARLPKRDSDAEFLDDNIYATEPGMPGEAAPKGLLDRLYRERYSGRPMRGDDGGGAMLPTTKNRYA
jgi:hypothetical protein